MRPSLPVLAVLLGACWLGCSNAPDIVSSGRQEAPCASGDDCLDGYACIRTGKASFCSQKCARFDSTCPSGYRCSTEQEICVPTREGECRSGHERCGAEFDPCCSGTACVDWADWGAVCSPRCAADENCWSGCCLPVSGESRGVCAPPAHCE